MKFEVTERQKIFRKVHFFSTVHQTSFLTLEHIPFWEANFDWWIPLNFALDAVLSVEYVSETSG